MRESAIPIPGYRIDACISTGSASTLRTLLLKLRGLLEDADAEATEVAEELEPLLRNSIQGQSLELVGQVASFDFEAALETLRDIEERQV